MLHDEILTIPVKGYCLAMAVRQQDQGGVPVTMPAKAPSAGHELLNLARREVLPRAAVDVLDADRWSDFPVYSVWTPWADGA